MSRLRAVVTGGAGFIGSHIVDRLVRDGYEVIVFDDLSGGSPDNLSRDVVLEQVDLAETEAASKIAATRPAVVVHCAAKVSVEASFERPIVDATSNVLGSINAIQGAVSGGAAYFAYITSGGALHGTPVSIPTGETEAVTPSSPYGWNKWIVEQYLHLLAEPNLPWSALRLANVYGPRQRSDGEGGVIARFCRATARGELIRIDGDGEQTRDFVFVGDVADATSLAIQGSSVGAYNIGTGRETSINELIHELSRIAGLAGAVVHGPARVGDIRRSALDPEKARTVLGWRANVTLAEGLQTTWAALR